MAAVNLEINGTGIRISCPRRIARALRFELAAHVVNDELPLGFLVRPTSFRNRSYVLTDRCGFVLGKARRTEHILAMLGSHLDALSPVPDGRARFRLRALTDGQSVTACAFPVLYIPAFDESQLVSTAYDVVDRLAIDVDSGTGELVGGPPQWFGTASTGPGHQRLPTSRPVSGLLLAGSAGAGAYRSELIARVACEALAGERNDVLDAATALVNGATSVRIVDLAATTKGLRHLLNQGG